MSDINHDFVAAVNAFPWDSEDQKQGYLALTQYLRRFDGVSRLPIDRAIAFLIQKDHESNEWWTAHVSNIDARLRKEIERLTLENLGLRSLLDSLAEKVAELRGD